MARTKYWDKESQSWKYADRGRGGGSSAPVFDLVAMGLPAITLDGVAVSCICDTAELRSALAKGLVRVKVNVTNDTDVTEAEALVVQSMSVTDTVHQTVTRAEIYGKFYDFQMYVRENGIVITAVEVKNSGIPAYTEADYGKFLSCSAEGLVWAEAIPDGEEMTF